jgi:hypothetical protein
MAGMQFTLCQLASLVRGENLAWARKTGADKVKRREEGTDGLGQDSWGVLEASEARHGRREGQRAEREERGECGRIMLGVGQTRVLEPRFAPLFCNRPRWCSNPDSFPPTTTLPPSLPPSLPL